MDSNMGKQEHRERFNSLKTSIPVRQGQFLGEEGESFYIAKSEEEVYELSPLAYYVWLLCDGEHNVEEIANRMSSDLKMSVEEIVDPLIMALDGLSNVELVSFK